jgi:hypothetical protein
LLLDQGRGEKVGANEQRVLKEAYSYLYSQRFGSLFDDCHDALWNLATAEMRKTELLRIFRFSSFLWRIYGRFQREAEYISRLKTVLSPTFANVAAASDKNDESGIRYYVSRLEALGE